MLRQVLSLGTMALLACAVGTAQAAEVRQPAAASGQQQDEHHSAATPQTKGTAAARPAAARELDAIYEKCAQACNDCQRICDACATHCAHLLAQGHKTHLRTLMTCQDCAAVCAVAAQIVSRKGPFSAAICQACAEACARCAKACEAHPDDEMMRQCAEECRRCEEACRQMVTQVRGAKGAAAEGDHSHHPAPKKNAER